MSGLDDFEFDPHEYADQLGYTDELGRHDLSEQAVIRAETREERSRGLTRRELLVKGGVGAAAVSGLGAIAGTAAAKPASAGKFTGTINMISLGVEWPQGAQQQ